MKPATILIVVVLISTAARSAFAGPLPSDPEAYDYWHGTTALPLFDPPSGLQGYVEWAVYDRYHSPDGLTGYVRTPGEFLYAYQVYVTSGPTLIEFDVDLEYEANNIGSFTATGISGDTITAATITPEDHAAWMFGGIESGSHSVGLVFSSPNPPMFLYGTARDSNGFATVTVVPSAGPPLPEPASFVLAACALVGLAAAIWRQRRKV